MVLWEAIVVMGVLREMVELVDLLVLDEWVVLLEPIFLVEQVVMCVHDDW